MIDYEKYIHNSNISYYFLLKTKTSLFLNLLRSTLNVAIYNFIETQSKYILEAVRTLEKEDIIRNRELIATLMLEIFDTEYNYLPDPYRQAICHIDNTLYSE